MSCHAQNLVSAPPLTWPWITPGWEHGRWNSKCPVRPDSLFLWHLPEGGEETCVVIHKLLWMGERHRANRYQISKILIMVTTLKKKGMSAKSRPYSWCGMFSKQVWKEKGEEGEAQTKNNIRPGAASLFQVLKNRRLYLGWFLGNKVGLCICL